MLPNFFSTITKHQFDGVVATLKRKGPEAAGACQKGTGPKKRISDEARATVKDLAVSPVRRGAIERRHFSQREIARHLNILKTKCTDDILNIFEYNITFVFEKIILCKNKSLMTNFPLF